MALLTPSGDTTGATDLAAINAMGPNDELGVGTYYVNDAITATVIRGVEWAHWGTFYPTALTTIIPVPGAYAEGAALVNHAQGYYEGFTLDGFSMGAGFNGVEIGGSTEPTFNRVQIQTFPGVGLRGTTNGVIGLRFCQSRVQGCGDWGVKIDSVSDSLFYSKFDVSNCGAAVTGAGGIYILYGIGNGWVDGEIQDMYGFAPDWAGEVGVGLQIDGGSANRIALLKFDQCNGGNLFLNCANTSIIGNISESDVLGLHLGGKTFGIRSRDNTWGGTSYKCDPRDATIGALTGKFDDNVQGTLYADTDTQTIMQGLVL